MFIADHVAYSQSHDLIYYLVQVHPSSLATTWPIIFVVNHGTINWCTTHTHMHARTRTHTHTHTHTHRRMLWVKSTLSSKDTQNLHRAALACESDISMAGVVLLKHPNMRTGQEFITSLDHSITFHAPVQSDKWHLFVTECEHAAGTRALNISKWVTPCVCSVMT